MVQTEYNDLRIEFNSLFKEMTDVYHNIALKLGISDSAFLILYAVVELGCGCTQKDIVDMYYMSKQTINSSIKNLEKAGYIEFKQDKGNNKQIFLTSSELPPISYIDIFSHSDVSIFESSVFDIHTA